MKKGPIFLTSAAVVAAAAGGYFLLRPQPTSVDVKAPVDEQYEKIEKTLNDLEAKVQQPESNVDSLFNLMDAIRWSAIGETEYEKQKVNLYLDHKKNVTMTFRKVMQERQLEITNPHLIDVESISE
ncbi:MAG: hypothetical protein K5683_04335 [Prevotella sp.]|nr:hypothetical protein [Prevotella sp.]